MFIEVTQTNTNKISINLKHIISVSQGSGGSCKIKLITNEEIAVREIYQTVLASIQRAINSQNT